MDKMDGVNFRMADTYTRLINDIVVGISKDCFYYAKRIQDGKNAIKNSRGMHYDVKVAIDKRIAFYENIIMNRAKNLMENLALLPVQTKVDPECLAQTSTRKHLISIGVIKPTE